MLFSIFFFSSSIKLFDYYSYSGKLTTKFVKTIEEKYKIHLGGSGGSFNGGSINFISWHFSSNEKITQSDARKMIVMITEGLKQIYDNDIKVRPFLKNYPFTNQNLDLMIGFRSNDKIIDHNLSLIRLENGMIYYFYYTGEVDTNKCVKETYQEAKQKYLEINL